jgi:NADH:ubiquinone oxidoreductase subunit 2 (subunit N)
MQVLQVYRILPEVLLTLTGVLIMLIDPLMPSAMNRKPLGVMAVLGVIAALAASVWQLGLPPGTAYYGTVQTDAFSVFFHVLICGVVLVALLIALDAFDAGTENSAAYYALVVFGAVGMCLMSSAVELLLVFVSLEISSIATYILAAIRKRSGKSPEAGLKYFLLLLRYRLLPLRHCPHLRGYRNDQHHRDCCTAPAEPGAGLRNACSSHDPDWHWLQGLGRALPGVDARCV